MIAFICSTPIQIMRCVQLKMTYEDFVKKRADIYIHDKFEKVDSIIENISTTDVFNKVLKVQNGIKHEKVEYMFGKKSISKYIQNTYYDSVVTFQSESSLAVAIYSRSCRQGKVRLYLGEDAPIGAGLCYNAKPKFNLMQRVLGMKPIIPNIDVIFQSGNKIYNIPDNLKDKVKIMQTFSETEIAIKETLNFIFGYRAENAFNNADILFMQDSYVAEGLVDGSGERNLLRMIQERYPKMRIVVKYHPRNTEDIFGGKYRSFSGNEIPWELICLNLSDNNENMPIIIGTGCSTMISDKLAAGKELKKISVLNYFRNEYWKGIEILEKYSDLFMERYIKVRETYDNPENFVFCDSIEDVWAAIERMRDRE